MVNGNHRRAKIIRKPFRQAGSNQIINLYSSIKYILKLNDIVRFYFDFLIIRTGSTYKATPIPLGDETKNNNID